MLHARAYVFRARFPVSGTRKLATVAHGKQPFIPVINFAKFRVANSEAERQETAAGIVSAFKESGFVYLEGHGIPAGMSKRFVVCH